MQIEKREQQRANEDKKRIATLEKKIRDLEAGGVKPVAAAVVGVMCLSERRPPIHIVLSFIKISTNSDVIVWKVNYTMNNDRIEMKFP